MFSKDESGDSPFGISLEVWWKHKLLYVSKVQTQLGFDSYKSMNLSARNR
jgi:hypothetical protein